MIESQIVGECGKLGPSQRAVNPLPSQVKIVGSNPTSPTIFRKLLEQYCFPKQRTCYWGSYKECLFHQGYNIAINLARKQ